MPKVWCVRSGEPWPTAPQAKKSLKWCIDQLRLSDDDFQLYLDQDKPPCPPVPGGPSECVFVEIDELEEFRYGVEKWEKGFYWIKSKSCADVDRLMGLPIKTEKSRRKK